MKRIYALLAAFGVALAVLVGAPAVTQQDAAQAGNCVNAATGFCGKIKVGGTNTIWLFQNWGSPSAPAGYFRPGTRSTDIWRDTDGFTTRPGWCTNWWLGEVKNADNFVGTVGQGNTQVHDAYKFHLLETWDC